MDMVAGLVPRAREDGILVAVPVWVTLRELGMLRGAIRETLEAVDGVEFGTLLGEGREGFDRLFEELDQIAYLAEAQEVLDERNLPPVARTR